MIISSAEVMGHTSYTKLLTPPLEPYLWRDIVLFEKRKGYLFEHFLKFTMTKTIRSIPSLDGLRAVSIALVLFGHLLGTRCFPLGTDSPYLFGLASLGVRIFFVISGFLITGLLLKEKAKQGRVSLVKFYFRRTLRIFPPFYAYLSVMAILVALGYLSIPTSDFTHAALYIANIIKGHSWHLGHLWSLALEEQFYLIWPGVIVLFGLRRGRLMLLLPLILAPMLRYFGFRYGFLSDWALHYGPLANMDALACGCGLAILRRWLHTRAWFLRLLNVPFAVLPLCIMIVLLNTTGEHPIVYYFIAPTAINCTIAYLVDRAVTFDKSIMGLILNTRPFMWIGTISYSLYLWQQPFLNRDSTSVISNFPLNLGLAALCAILSYYTIERYSLRLRGWLEHRFFAPILSQQTRQNDIHNLPTQIMDQS